MASGKIILNDNRSLFRRIRFTSNTALSLNSGVAKSVRKQNCNFYVPDGYVPFSIVRAYGGGNAVSMTRAGTYILDSSGIDTDAIMTVLNETTSTKSVTPTFDMIFIRSDCLDISKTKKVLKFIFDEYENKSTSIRVDINHYSSSNPENFSAFYFPRQAPYWILPGTTVMLIGLQNSSGNNISTNTDNFNISVTYGNGSDINLTSVSVAGGIGTKFIMPERDVTITLTAK